MTNDQPLSPLPSAVAILTIVVLATALGTILGGLRGMQAGWIAGLLLSFAPYAATRLWARMKRPDGLARLLAREVAAGLLRAATGAGNAISRVAAPPAAAIARVLQLPFLVIGFVASVLISLAGDLLARLLGQIATPLGIANIGAVVIIVADVTGSELASLACFIGLVVLILVLMISESERLSAPS